MRMQQWAIESHVQKSRGERGMRHLTRSYGPRAVESWKGDTAHARSKAGRTALENRSRNRGGTEGVDEKM